MSGHRLPFDLFNAQNKRMNDPATGGTLRVDRDLGHVALVSGASAKAITLAVPVQANLSLLLYFKTDGGGDITLTITGGCNQAGNTTAVFSDAGEWIKFVSVEVGSNLRWRVLGSDGVVLS